MHHHMFPEKCPHSLQILSHFSLNNLYFLYHDIDFFSIMIIIKQFYHNNKIYHGITSSCNVCCPPTIAYPWKCKINVLVI